MRNRTEDQMILAFIRHGETQANAQRRYLGKTDESLSERGKQLLLLSCQKQHVYPQADCLFCSPMKRCLETARILYPMLPPVVIPEWDEMDFGRFEYKNYEELKDDSAYRRWMDSGGTTAFPGGESREAFVKRCKDGFQRMCGILWQTQAEEQAERLPDKKADREQGGETDIGADRRTGIGAGGKTDGERREPVRAAAVVHGGVIMALLSAYGSDGHKDYFDYQTANGRGYLTRITYAKGSCGHGAGDAVPGAEDCRKENTAVQRLKEKEGETEIMIEDIKAL